MFVSMCGTWIQSMAQNWLVFELSHSSFILGLVGFVNYSPIIFISLFSGVLVDRCNKRTLLLFTQISFMCLAFVLAVLTHLNFITVKGILFIALLQGTVLSLDSPARQSIIVELVGSKNILNAIALNSIGFHSARMIGPAIAGVLMAFISIAGCFYLNAFSFLAFIVALFLIRPRHEGSGKRSHFLDELRSGVRFMWNDKIYLVLISITGFISLFGVAYVTLLPVFTKTVLHLEVRGYGLLMSASGIGSLLGGLMLASLKKPRLQPPILFCSLIAFSLCMIGFSFARSLAVAVAILIGAGFFSLSVLTIVNSLIQGKVPHAFRGRVMSVYMITFAGTIPFGSLLAGVLAEHFGLRQTLFLFGVICFMIFAFMTKRLRRFSLIAVPS